MQVLRLAAEIKKAYMEERREFYLLRHGSDANYMPRRDTIAQWDGGRDHRGAVHKSAWESIARFAMENNVSPIELIKAVFSMWKMADPPLPTHIKSMRALTDLKYLQENSVNDTKRRFITYNEEAKLQFLIWKKTRNQPDEQSWLDVIYSAELQLSGLYRFILAASMNLTSAADHWRKVALQEYLKAPNLYNEALGDKIPLDFREEAARVSKVLSRS